MHIICKIVIVPRCYYIVLQTHTVYSVLVLPCIDDIVNLKFEKA